MVTGAAFYQVSGFTRTHFIKAFLSNRPPVIHYEPQELGILQLVLIPLLAPSY